MSGMVTIFADASVNTQHKRAGAGAWAKGDGRSSVLYRKTLEYDRNVTLAELRALRFMIEHLFETGYIQPDDDAIMLQSDCLQALWVLSRIIPYAVEKKHPNGAPLSKWKQRSSESVWQRREAEAIRQALGSRRVYLRHVRGHKEGDGRQWVNEQCDRLAKKAAWEGSPA